MTISNLLSLTQRSRKTEEVQVLSNSVNAQYNGKINEQSVLIDAQKATDTIDFNGRVVDIMGNLTDEQISAIFDFGYKNSVNLMVEILTTCKDITDEELIDIFINKTNAGRILETFTNATNPDKESIPKRLHLIRGNARPTDPDPTDPDPTDPDPTDPDPTDPDPTDPDPTDPDPTDPDPTDPDPTDPDPTDPDNPIQADYTLIRKGTAAQKSVKVTATKDGVTVCLKNPLNNGQGGPDSDGKYYYKVESLSSGNIDVTFQVLDNGRIVIEGNNVKITAYSNQKDDLIIIGHNNEINTEDGNDIIRLGISVDMSGVENNKNESYTGETPILTALKNATNNNVYNNKIYLGAGDDYLYDYTNHQGGAVNTIDGGNDNDAYRNCYSDFKIFTETNAVVNIEDVFTDTNKANSLNNNSTDYTMEAFGQGAIGDCRFIALLSSLKLSHNNLEDFGIEISKSGTQYTVTFNKFKTAAKYSGEGNQYSLTFNENEIWNNNTSIYAHGDITVRLVEYAMNELIKLNMGEYRTYAENPDGSFDTSNIVTKVHDLSTTSSNDYARYLYGTSDFSWQNNYDYSKPIKPSDYWGSNVLTDVFNFTEADIIQLNNEGIYTVDQYLASFNINSIQEYYDYPSVNKHLNTLDELWAMYQAGTITNLNCGTYSDSRGFSDELQICSMHAYAITNVTSAYVEVINPWDSQDRLRLDREDFFKYFSSIDVYGSKILANAPAENWNTTVLTDINSDNEFETDENSIAQVDDEFSILNNYYYNQSEAENSSDSTKHIAELKEKYKNMQHYTYSEKNTIIENTESSNPFANLFSASEDAIFDEINAITESFEAVKQILEQPKKLKLFS